MDKPDISFLPHQNRESTKKIAAFPTMKKEMRRGFALIITLSALTVVIALTAVLVNYLDVVRKDAGATKAMIQGNLYYTDIKTFFGKIKEKKTLYTALYASPIPIISPDGRFSLIVSCAPLANGVNINWLGQSENQKMSAQYTTAQHLFEAIVEQYDLEDGTRLEEMLLEVMRGKQRYIQREEGRLRQKNAMISFEQFEALLTQYQFETDDQKVASVPWKKFFVFNELKPESKENVMDGDYLSAELVSALFGLDLSFVKEAWIEGEGALKAFLAENAVTYDQKLFSKTWMQASQCKVYYDYEGERYGFGFVDIEGEVKHFEFFGQQ